MLRPARVALSSVSLLSALALSTAARADVSKPFNGVTVVAHPGHGSMAIVNLCAPGVSVRATRHGERKRTASSWGQALKLQAAINADFFDFPGWTWVAGRARGAGEDWPAGAQQHYASENRPYWSFGPAIARFVDHNATPPEAGVTDMVGGHDTVIHNGQKQSFSDAFSTAKTHRSGIGISGDRSTLFLFSTSDSIDLNQLSGQMMALAQEGGGPAIAFATNVDGGGSSQLYVAGKGELVSSTRQVNNHLGVFASGSGPSPNCPNEPPRGSLDQAGCTTVSGWAQDPDDPDKAIAAHVYFDGPPGAAGATGVSLAASQHRDDLCNAIQSCNHGFSYPSPHALFDGKPHEVRLYGIDTAGGGNPELGHKTLTCAAPKLAGVRHHVPGPSVLAAWKFSTFRDLAHVPDAALDALDDTTDWPAEPRLIQVKGKAAVWLVDGARRRHVPSPSVAATWNLDLASVAAATDAEVDALTEGTPLPPRPLLAKGSGDAVYVVDDDVPDAPGAAGSGGSGQAGSAGDGGSAGQGGSAGGAAGALGQGQGGAGGAAGGAAQGGVGASAGGKGGASGKGSGTVTVTTSSEDEGGCATSARGERGAGAWLALLALAARGRRTRAR